MPALQNQKRIWDNPNTLGFGLTQAGPSYRGPSGGPGLSTAPAVPVELETRSVMPGPVSEAMTAGAPPGAAPTAGRFQPEPPPDFGTWWREYSGLADSPSGMRHDMKNLQANYRQFVVQHQMRQRAMMQQAGVQQRHREEMDFRQAGREYNRGRDTALDERTAEATKYKRGRDVVSDTRADRGESREDTKLQMLFDKAADLKSRGAPMPHYLEKGLKAAADLMGTLVYQTNPEVKAAADGWVAQGVAWLEEEKKKQQEGVTAAPTSPQGAGPAAPAGPTPATTRPATDQMVTLRVIKSDGSEQLYRVPRSELERKKREAQQQGLQIQVMEP